MAALIMSRRFGPLFVTQFLGAFNDNLFKTAFIFLVAYRLRAGDPAGAASMATVAAGVFILPFFLFSGLAGMLADARDKAAIARWVKIAEIGFMALGWTALALGSEPLCLGVLFLMGVHSTLFGPVKYAILPQHLGATELLAGTGMVEGATFVAILLGQVAGGLIPTPLVGPVVISVALAGWLAARAIPPAPPDGNPPLDWNPVRTSRAAVASVLRHQSLAIATLAVSWFWALGAIYTSQFVPLVRNGFGGSEAVATLFLAIFSVGVGAGSVLCGRLSRGRIAMRPVVGAAVAMAAAGVDLYFAGQGVDAVPKDVASFVALPAAWRIMFDLFALALAGGVFSVPLYGVLQTAGDAATRASAIAANNIVNSAFQVAAVLGIGVAVSAGAGLPLVLMLSALTGLVLVPVLLRLPR